MGVGVVRCDRCNRRFRGQTDWNVTMAAGVPIGYLCPGCQTPLENVEAVVNLATLDYAADHLGRAVARVKGGVGDR